MTMQAITSFLEKAQSEPGLAETLVEIVEENEAEAIYAKVAALASDSGFEVTAADAQEAHKQFQAAMGGADGDLSDDDLENVAGGVAPAVVAAGIGAVGAVTAAGVGAGGAVAAGGVTGGAAITAAVVSNGVNKTVNDVGKFFSRW